MSLRPAPAFIGKITIIPGVNDIIYWFEAGPFDLSVALTGGGGPSTEFWPQDLAVQIAADMTAESAASGATNTYSGSFSQATGKITITRTAGAAAWNPKATALADNIWTGGMVDSAGDALSTGQYGLDHAGWIIAVANPAPAVSHSSDQVVASSWLPSLPPAQDSEEMFENTVVEAIAIDGSGSVYSFAPWAVDKDEFPLYGGLWTHRTVRFDRLTQADTTWFLSQFWGPWAGAGGEFRFYPDRTSNTYYTMRFTGDTLRSISRGSRELGYALWSLPLEMRRHAQP